jgi:hypothetical protein
MNQQIDNVAAQRAGEVSIPFAAELFGRVASAAKADANVFVSPYSVGTALALTLEGAKGDTAGQLKKAIGYGPDHDPQKLHHDIVSLIYSVRFSSTRLHHSFIFIILPHYSFDCIFFTAQQGGGRGAVGSQRALGLHRLPDPPGLREASAGAAVGSAQPGLQLPVGEVAPDHQLVGRREDQGQDQGPPPRRVHTHTPQRPTTHTRATAHARSL